ncbi:hypothetical protein HDV00_012030, partial [Rhizophlyctis rosea]
YTLPQRTGPSTVLTLTQSATFAFWGTVTICTTSIDNSTASGPQTEFPHLGCREYDANYGNDYIDTVAQGLGSTIVAFGALCVGVFFCVLYGCSKERVKKPGVCGGCCTDFGVLAALAGFVLLYSGAIQIYYLRIFNYKPNTTRTDFLSVLSYTYRPGFGLLVIQCIFTWLCAPWAVLGRALFSKEGRRELATEFLWGGVRRSVKKVVRRNVVSAGRVRR